jgi:hypothetical protein
MQIWNGPNLENAILPIRGSVSVQHLRMISGSGDFTGREIAKRQFGRVFHQSAFIAHHYLAIDQTEPMSGASMAVTIAGKRSLQSLDASYACST